ncbi:hypothetical protein VUR80DRAFT_6074 [Thermomyces stellatus]
MPCSHMIPKHLSLCRPLVTFPPHCTRLGRQGASGPRAEQIPYIRCVSLPAAGRRGRRKGDGTKDTLSTASPRSERNQENRGKVESGNESRVKYGASSMLPLEWTEGGVRFGKRRLQAAQIALVIFFVHDPVLRGAQSLRPARFENPTLDSQVVRPSRREKLSLMSRRSHLAKGTTKTGSHVHASKKTRCPTHGRARSGPLPVYSPCASGRGVRGARLLVLVNTTQRAWTCRRESTIRAMQSRGCVPGSAWGLVPTNGRGDVHARFWKDLGTGRRGHWKHWSANVPKGGW